MRNITEVTRRQNPLLLSPELKVCAYVRVSTDHREQLNSLENQTKYYERLISSNPAYKYCGIFTDSDRHIQGHRKPPRISGYDGEPGPGRLI